jgi:hypothetical protein
VTEAEWLTGDVPASMLDVVFDFLGLWRRFGHVYSRWCTGRRSRLLGVAFCRQLYIRFSEEQRLAILSAELFADKLCGEEEMSLRRRRVHPVDSSVGIAWMPVWASNPGVTKVENVLGNWLGTWWSVAKCESAADIVRDVIPNPFRPPLSLDNCPLCTTDDAAERDGRTLACHGCGGRFPLHPLLFPRVLALAEAAYNDRDDSGRMDQTTIFALGDYLEEEGVAGGLLTHLRNGKPHYRGCWVVDLILGKR